MIRRELLSEFAIIGAIRVKPFFQTDTPNSRTALETPRVIPLMHALRLTEPRSYWVRLHRAGFFVVKKSSGSVEADEAFNRSSSLIGEIVPVTD